MVIRTQTDIGGGYGLIQLRQAARGFLRQASKFFKHVQPVFGLDLDETEPWGRAATLRWESVSAGGLMLVRKAVCVPARTKDDGMGRDR